MGETSLHIKSEKHGFLGLLTLARPQALNALDHGMILDITARLQAWAADDGIKAVAIRGEGPRAFCSGGDIRAVQQAVVAGKDTGIALLRDEYRMNALIGAYPKPYIALIHGICMGGGAGVSVHGRYRLADASLSFAMPETGIGFIPDVGSSHFLSRLPDEMGMYLGLTGSPVGLGDALEAGLMTHAVSRGDFEAVIAALAEGGDFAPFVHKREPGPLAANRKRIATLFSASSVEAILERLDRDGSEFARDTAREIRTRSPTSLKLVFRQLREARSLNLKQCLAMEFRLANRVLFALDFREGVRAALVDKDRNPQWQPASLAGVGDVDAFFAPLRDELF
ncbi:MAG TPA: enoyl-CoA hydratase/isomerase family protein [Rhizomicrobium sp.]|jgi:enoyl-CoA hydratase|nr:enoyl-CoA hydratase/isomerase family protein [Rhizomicrobium sp.]